MRKKCLSVIALMLVCITVFVLTGCGGIKSGTYYYCSANGNLVHINDDETCDVAMTPIKGSASNLLFKNCNYTIEDDRLMINMPLSSMKTSGKNPFESDINLEYNILDNGDRIEESESGSGYDIITEDEANSIIARNETNTVDFKTNTIDMK